jgi:tetrahydromethanopterin S-methyltransferase subunit G
MTYHRNDTRVTRIDTRVTRIDTRITRIDTRITRIDTRVTRIDTRVTRIDTRVTRIDTRITRIDTRVTRIDTRVTRIDTRVTRIDTRVTRRPSFVFGVVFCILLLVIFPFGIVLLSFLDLQLLITLLVSSKCINLDLRKLATSYTLLIDNSVLGGFFPRHCFFGMH